MISDIGEVYSVEDFIGEGRFSNVYRGVRIKSGQIHALKVISTKHMEDNDCKLLKQETDILRAVDHPSIVRCIECFETKDEVVIAMELLAGTELFDVISSEDDAMTEARYVSIMRQATEGIAHLNQMGVAHRDIKPENLVFADKSNTVIKITDLGPLPLIMMVKVHSHSAPVLTAWIQEWQRCWWMM